MKRTTLHILLALAALGILVSQVKVHSPGGSSTVGAEANTSGKTTPPAAGAIDMSAAMQQKRQDIINKLTGTGIFTEVDGAGDVARVTVGPSFYLLDFKQKQTFVSVVSALHGTSEQGAIVRLIDSRSGKKVGLFTQYGLSMD